MSWPKAMFGVVSRAGRGPPSMQRRDVGVPRRAHLRAGAHTISRLSLFLCRDLIGGGIVFNGSLFRSQRQCRRTRSMPIMRREPNGDASLQQLIRTASIYR